LERWSGRDGDRSCPFPAIGRRHRTAQSVGKPRFIRAPSSGRRASKGDLSEPIPRSRRVAAQTRGPRTALRATLITTALKNGAQFEDVQNAAGVVTQAPQSYMIAAAGIRQRRRVRYDVLDEGLGLSGNGDAGDRRNSTQACRD
jgi:hypothetical protein